MWLVKDKGGEEGDIEEKERRVVRGLQHVTTFMFRPRLFRAPWMREMSCGVKTNEFADDVLVDDIGF
jgi:hypothetical protein